ncbi:MAG: 50S ribosomal protein L30 [Candidatus Dadabacteria bacterium]|nr:MAG: 50S ribosomal protein L30 [Candidatus Dadabacteria bacterium]
MSEKRAEDFIGKKVLVSQVRSVCGASKRQRATLSALGLGKIGKRREFTLNESLVGMLRRVRHLVIVREAA